MVMRASGATVGAGVTGGERSLAEPVTDRVYRPRAVECDADAHEAGAQEAGQGAGPPVPEEAERERDREGRHRERDEQPVDPDDVGIGEQVRRVLLAGGRVDREHPADVCVPEAAEPVQGCVALPQRRVRVAGAVGEPVMAPVVGHPADHRALEGEGPDGGEGDLQRPLRHEAAVREHAMEADRDGVTEDHDQDQRQPDCEPRERLVGRDQQAQGDERGDREDRGEDLPVGRRPGEGPGVTRRRLTGDRGGCVEIGRRKDIGRQLRAPRLVHGHTGSAQQRGTAPENAWTDPWTEATGGCPAPGTRAGRIRPSNRPRGSCRAILRGLEVP